jgi:DNA-binding transcriptional ArsR family regulator
MTIRIDPAAAVEKALSPSQRCEVFRLLGATVETMVVVKLGTPGLWVTVSDLARRLRVSKQAVSKRIERLESSGVLQTRSGPRGAKLVNLAQFDKAAGQLTDAARQLEDPLAVPLRARSDVLCFVPETGAWACGGRSGEGFVTAIAALFSVDQARAAALVCEVLGRSLIDAGAEAKAGGDQKSIGQVGHLIETPRCAPPVERENTPAKSAEPRA